MYVSFIIETPIHRERKRTVIKDTNRNLGLSFFIFVGIRHSNFTVDQVL
jgi:hypothetical protein